MKICLLFGVPESEAKTQKEVDIYDQGRLVARLYYLDGRMHLTVGSGLTPTQFGGRFHVSR